MKVLKNGTTNKLLSINNKLVKKVENDVETFSGSPNVTFEDLYVAEMARTMVISNVLHAPKFVGFVTTSYNSTYSNASLYGFIDVNDLVTNRTIIYDRNRNPSTNILDSVEYNSSTHVLKLKLKSDTTYKCFYSSAYYRVWVI